MHRAESQFVGYDMQYHTHVVAESILEESGLAAVYQDVCDIWIQEETKENS
jgi:hypothetical protein